MSDNPEILSNDAVLSDAAEPVTNFTDDDTGDPENDNNIDDLTTEELAALKLMLRKAKTNNPNVSGLEEVN